MFVMLPTLIAQFGDGFDTTGLPLSENAASDEGALTNFELIISNFVGFMTIMAGIFFLIYFIIAAFNWVTSGGESSKLQASRDRMLHAVLGLIIVVGSYAIVGLLGTIIGLDVLRPSDAIRELTPGAPTFFDALP